MFKKENLVFSIHIYFSRVNEELSLPAVLRKRGVRKAITLNLRHPQFRDSWAVGTVSQGRRGAFGEKCTCKWFNRVVRGTNARAGSALINAWCRCAFSISCPPAAEHPMRWIIRPPLNLAELILRPLSLFSLCRPGARFITQAAHTCGLFWPVESYGRRR